MSFNKNDTWYFFPTSEFAAFLSFISLQSLNIVRFWTVDQTKTTIRRLYLIGKIVMGIFDRNINWLSDNASIRHGSSSHRGIAVVTNVSLLLLVYPHILYSLYAAGWFKLLKYTTQVWHFSQLASPVCYRSALQALICDAQLWNSFELSGSVWRRTMPDSWCKLWCPHGEVKKPLPECQGAQGGVSWFKISLLWLLDKSWYCDNELQHQRDISRGMHTYFDLISESGDITFSLCDFINSWCVSTGGVLSVRSARGLLESHEGVHAVFSWPQRPWTAVCVCCQAWRTFCTSRLCGHHDSVPGVVQQTSQTANCRK